MNCQRARQSFAELLDSRPAAPRDAESAAEIDAVRAHLANCPDCQREFASLSQTLAALDALPTPAPSSQLRRDFYALLEEEKNSAASIRASADREKRQHRAALWRLVLAPLGAAAFLAIGFIAGTRVAPPAQAPATLVADAATRRELQDLRAKVDRMESMNQLVAASFQQQQRPASERFHGVLTSTSTREPQDRVVDELITSLALDSSVNVRLRALEALFPYANQEVVRAGVLASLTREPNPVVQVSMIDFLASARDREAKPTLEKLAVNELTHTDVREAARRALTQL
ncbi:HEAT repeat domain-containing protein [Opitutus sp. ER46]|uniref:HEAT repeat domain-containing protein n=1 Tax=Opitutus sp. ER46 TaxID=2161864 RepID=UPI000D2F9796|nr:HEAT repeat domain-containing protein [Opitutus sp. ER46]PTX95470.1 hypothetical protein DB354_08570 [Opitutus sp. ER46]